MGASGPTSSPERNKYAIKGIGIQYDIGFPLPPRHFPKGF
jgi:hypothetical protein